MHGGAERKPMPVKSVYAPAREPNAGVGLSSCQGSRLAVCVLWVGMGTRISTVSPVCVVVIGAGHNDRR